MANWEDYKDYVKPVGKEAKINFIDPNEINISSREKGIARSLNETKEWEKPIIHTWCPEDYCIDVDLTLEVPSRNDYGHSGNKVYLLKWNGKGDEISIQSGHRFYYGKNNADDNVNLAERSSDPHINYLSTRDIDITYYDLIEDNISTEMLGLNSIDISYETYFCPIVKMQFTDVHGIALFSPMEHNHTNMVDGIAGYSRNDIASSFYRALFNLPYPKATLRVKGLYGAPTLYELTFKNISTSFDNSSGGFKINVELMGYIYSFLSEVPILHSMISPTSKYYGQDYWNNHKGLEDYKINGSEPLTWMEMVKRITDAKGKIQEQEDNSKDNSTDIQKAKNNEVMVSELNNLSALQSATLNACSAYIESAFPQGTCKVVQGSGYIAIGYNGGENKTLIDFADIINKKGLLEKANDDLFKTFINNKEAEKTAQTSALENKNMAKGGNFGILVATQKNFNGEWKKSSGFNFDFTTYDGFFDNVSDEMKGELSNIYTIFPNCNCIVFVSYANTKDGKYINAKNNIQRLINNFTNNQKALDDKAEEQRNTIVQECLGFKPTLRNIMQTLMFHCETYFNMIQECAREAKSLSDQRKASDLGFEMSVADFKTDIVPPFPEYCEKQKDKWVQGWIGNIKQSGIEPERKFVDAMFNAVEDGEKEINEVADTLDTTNDAENRIAPIGGSYTTAQMNYAIIPNDVMCGGYAFSPMEQADFDSFIKDGNASALVTILYLRAMSLFGLKVKNEVVPSFFKSKTNSKISMDLNNANNIQQIADMDAMNFYQQFNKQGFLTTDLANKLEQVLNNGNIGTELSNIINGKGHIDLDANKELLTTTYAEENGCDTKELVLPSKCYIVNGGLDNGSLKHTNDLYKGDKPTTLSKLGDTTIIRTDTTLTDEKYPNKVGDIKNRYSDFRNYIVLDENMSLYKTQAIQRIKDNSYSNNTNPMYALLNMEEKGDYAVEGDYLPFFSNVYDKGNGKKKAKVDTAFECTNLFSKKIETTENHGDMNDKELFRNENAFASVFYYGIRNSDKAMQNIQRAIYMLVAEHDEVKDNGKYQDHYVTYKGFSVGNYAVCSKLSLLQRGALCFAHFFLNDTLYECFTDVNNYWCDNQFSSANSQGEKYSFVSSRFFVRGVENNIRNYALALYFYNWIDAEWKTLKDAFEFTEITDAKSYYDIMHNLHKDETKVKNIPSGYEKGGWEDESYGLEHNAQSGYEQVLTNMFMKNVFVMTCDYESVKMDFGKVFNSYMTQVLTKVKTFIKQKDENERLVQQKKEQTANNVVTDIAESDVPTDPKISIYQATKRLWDKWLCGMNENPITMKFFKEHFHFIDTFYNEIGDDILIDVTYLAETFVRVTDQRQDWNLLSYIQEILRKSNIQFHNIQNWADLGSTETMAKAFVPMSYIESHNMYPNDSYTSSISNTDFVCIYSYEPSHRLNYGDNKDPNASDTTDDSFTISYNDSLNDLPILMGEGMGSEFKIPAFAVTYAKQYQSYFHNIQVDSNAGMQTEWSIGATLNIAKQGTDKAGEALTYKGQDLYTIYSNQSFTCKVDMVGCGWVQPLMYFVLTNIPMYRGTYMIYKVTHSISGGQMKTHFEGYRISRIGNRLVSADGNNQRNSTAISSEPSLTTRKASINNDCGYTFHNPIQQTQTEFNVDYESTWNIDALKAYKPSYITKRKSTDGTERWENMWDAICGTLYREYCIVNIEGKITALSMLNLHAVGVKRYAKAFQRTRNSGKECKGGIFRGGWEQIMRQAFVGQFKKCKDQKFIKMVEEVFTNPIRSILGDKTEDYWEVPQQSFSYRLKPYPYPIDKSRSPFYLPNIPAYKYNKQNGSVKSATQKITKQTLRTIGRYSAPWEYAGHICGHHWDAMYYFTIAPKVQFTQLYSDTDMKGEIWTDEDFANWTKAPNATSTAQSNSSENDAQFADNFISCINQSMSETEAFGNAQAKIVKRVNYQNNTISKSIGLHKDTILITCDDREKNAMLFDMLCLGDNKGYYGWWDRLVWVTDSKSNENPQYLLISLRKNVGNDFTPSIYLHTLQSDDMPNNDLTLEAITKLSTSNFIQFNQKGADLKDIPTNFYKVMAKSVPTTANVNNNQLLQTFSYAFGSTDYVSMNFGTIENDCSIAYYLDKNKAQSCVQTLAETNEGNVEQIKDIVSVPTNESFADMFPNSETLRCSPTNKLKTFVGPVEYSQNITSDFKARTNPVTKKPENHKAVDFTSAKVPQGGNAVAGYDGKVVGIFLGSGYGYVVVVAYNIQNENGDLLVCGYPHFKQENIRVKVGQMVKAGDILSPLGKEGLATGIHSHFFIAWYKAENGKFKWDGRYGPHNELLKPINPNKYIEFQNVVNRR